jgi:hypothetical protein
MELEEDDAVTGHGALTKTSQLLVMKFEEDLTVTGHEAGRTGQWIVSKTVIVTQQHRNSSNSSIITKMTELDEEQCFIKFKFQILMLKCTKK